MAVRPYKRNGINQPGKWLVDYYDAKKRRQRLIFPRQKTGSDPVFCPLGVHVLCRVYFYGIYDY